MKNNKKKQQKQSKKQIVDLTSYLSPEIVASDPYGSYTGVPADMYYNDELDYPVQDADDL